LSGRERKALDRVAADKGVYLPAICQWEAQMLYRKRRVEFSIPFAAWLKRATSPEILTVVPLDADSVIAVNELPRAFHGDPADLMIVATARTLDMPLATHDQAIRKSGLVKIWKP
jgi:PIN domain nuclease of toxin-antitoxin system